MLQEFVTVDGLTQRLCSHGADVFLAKPGQPLPETLQTGPAPLHGIHRQHIVFIQTGTLPHGFLKVFHALNLPALVFPDFEAKAVGAQINCGQTGTVLHGGWQQKKINK